LPYTHVCGTFAAGAGAVEDFPGLPEGVVEEFHLLRHAAVGGEILAAERWEGFCWGG